MRDRAPHRPHEANRISGRRFRRLGRRLRKFVETDALMDREENSAQKNSAELQRFGLRQSSIDLMVRSLLQTVTLRALTGELFGERFFVIGSSGRLSGRCPWADDFAPN